MTNPTPAAIREASLQVFKTIRTRAIAHLNGKEQPRDWFSPSDGICYNIPRVNNTDVDTHYISQVKDNIIRQVPSFSGAYHYPVPHPSYLRGSPDSRRMAEDAWDHGGDRWKGIYGTMRFQQLDELIDYVENKWTDEWAGDITPARRLGLVVNETIVSYDHGEDKTLYVLHRDDGSTDPYFMPIGDTSTDSRRALDLNYICVVELNFVENYSIARFKREKAKLDKQKAKAEMLVAKLEAQLASANESLNKVKYEQSLLNVGLRNQHGFTFA